MVFAPTTKGRSTDACPLVTGVPFTAIALTGFPAVGVTVMLLDELGTVAVYAFVPCAKIGVNVPALMDKAVRTGVEYTSNSTTDANFGLIAGPAVIDIRK